MVSRRRKKTATPQTSSRPNRFLLISFGGRLSWEMVGPAIVFLFGAYLAILYFGHQAVPNSDFPAFVDTARSILRFQLPGSFKRLPGLGILQIALSTVVPGPHPVLTAGLLLNALMYPFCGLLLYGIARRFLGKASFWITLAALVNPWVLRWMVHPIVELPLIFFILLTFYLLFEKGRWAYAAAFAASMIRYEGAVLILIVFVWDLLRHRSWRQWLATAGLTFLAGLPVALWVLGQVLSHGAPGSGDYLGSYKAAAEGKPMVVGKFSTYLWQESFSTYHKVPSEWRMEDEEEEGEAPRRVPPGWGLLRISQVLFVLALLMAVGWGICRKQWDVLSLALFAGLYFLLHATRTFTLPRYAVPVIWIVFLIVLYGIRGIGAMIRQKVRIPRRVMIGLQLGLFGLSVALAVSLIADLSEFRRYSPQSAHVPLVGLGAAILYGLLELVRSKGTHAGWILAACGLTAFALTSSQINLLQRIGSGAMDKEFKDLAVWYIKTASPGEKMATTMPHILSLFAPGKQSSFVHTRRIEGEGPEEFIENCYKRNITYIAWDSRLGLATQNTYYRRYKLGRIAFLGPRAGQNNQMVLPPRQIGPFERIEIIRNELYPLRFIFIYKLHLPPTAGPKPPNP